MTWLDCALLVAALCVIALMVRTADALDHTEDSNGYNNERGTQNDDA